MADGQQVSDTVSGQLGLQTLDGRQVVTTRELADLVLTLEERFGIVVPDRAIGRIVYVQDLIDYIESITKRE